MAFGRPAREQGAGPRGAMNTVVKERREAPEGAPLYFCEGASARGGAPCEAQVTPLSAARTLPAGLTTRSDAIHDDGSSTEPHKVFGLGEVVRDESCVHVAVPLVSKGRPGNKDEAAGHQAQEGGEGTAAGR